MRVRAIAGELTPSQSKAIGGLARARRAGPRIGEEHLVIGLVFARDHPRLGHGDWVIYQDDIGNPLIEPLALYEIIDHRPSQFWRLSIREDGSTALLPPALDRPHFLEDAAEPNSPEREELNVLRSQLEAEALNEKRQ
jgi:hypothetical protein